jgi:hypothetical protein
MTPEHPPGTRLARGSVAITSSGFSRGSSAEQPEVFRDVHGAGIDPPCVFLTGRMQLPGQFVRSPQIVIIQNAIQRPCALATPWLRATLTP